MSNDLVKPDARAGATERLATSIELAPGQYWRTKHEIPELTEGYERDDYDWNLKKVVPKQATRRVRRRLPADQVLLVQSLKVVDGELHAVELAAHPLDTDRDAVRFLADDFFANFEFADDAELVRARELAQLNEEIRQIQEEIVNGPEDQPALPAGGEMPDMTGLIKHAANVEIYNQRAEQQLVLAKDRATWITDRTKRISGRIEVMALFHKEKASQALAAVDGTIQQVKRIQKGLRSLSLYTGDGVVVETVATGAGAPPEEPLVVYQQRLFLDEELQVMLGKGGIDADAIKHLPHFIANTPEFIERVAPSPRSVVLMNIRRHAILPENMGNIGQALEALAKARRDEAAFLLVRNGENIHMVWTDLIWSFDKKGDDFDANGLIRLFPSRNDLNQPFRGEWGRDITPDSLDYSEARARFDDRGLAYRRMLILMWGLSDRTSIFGEFYDRNEFDNWTSPDFIARHMRFVADEEMGLPENRAPVAQWARNKNAFLQSGSRVIGMWNALVNDRESSRDIAPGAYRWLNGPGKYEQVFYPVTGMSVEIVGSRGNDLYVTIPSKRHYYPEQGKNLQVYLGRYFEQGGDGLSGVLCLDAVTVEELDRYIESRRDRQHYLGYMSLFLEARRILVEDARLQAGPMAELEDAISQIASRGEAQRVAADVVRLWRAANKGRLLPDRRADQKVFDGLLNTAFVLLGKDIDVVALGVAAAENEGRIPLRVSVDHEGRIIVYAAPHPDEDIKVVGESYWVQRLVLDRTPTGPRVKSLSFELVTDVVASEVAIKTFEAASHWLNKTPPDRLTHDEWVEILRWVDEGAKNSDVFLTGEADPWFLEDAFDRVHKASKGGMVERVETRHPIALYTRHKKLRIVMLEEDPLFIAARASNELHDRAANWINGRYAHPEHHIPKLGNSKDGRFIRISYIEIGDWRDWGRTRKDAANIRTGYIGEFNTAEGRKYLAELEMTYLPDAAAKTLQTLTERFSIRPPAPESAEDEENTPAP